MTLAERLGVIFYSADIGKDRDLCAHLVHAYIHGVDKYDGNYGRKTVENPKAAPHEAQDEHRRRVQAEHAATDRQADAAETDHHQSVAGDEPQEPQLSRRQENKEMKSSFCAAA